MVKYKFLEASDVIPIGQTINLVNSVFNVNCSSNDLRKNIVDNEHCSTIVALNEIGDVVATATINYIQIPFEAYKQGYISYVCCQSNFRRQGITSQLINLLIEDANDEQCSHVFLDTNKKGRRAAHKMYKKLGFESKEDFFIRGT